MQIGVLNPLPRVFTTVSGLEEAIVRIQAETGATAIMQLCEPTTPLDVLKEYLSLAKIHGLKCLLGFRWSQEPTDPMFGRPNGREVSFLSDPFVQDNLDAWSLLDEPRRHRISPIEVVSYYMSTKPLAPRIKLQVGYSREIWKQPSIFAAGQCDVAQISCLEWQRIDPSQPFVYMRDQLIANHRASRDTIMAVDPAVEIWSSIQTFNAGNYGYPPIAEFRDALTLITDSALPPLSSINAQNWSGASALASHDYSEHRVALKELATSEPQLELEATEVYLPGEIVPVDGDYAPVSLARLTKGSKFPDHLWARRAWIRTK